ncbi:4Fe-4S ferredoxin [Eggerthellaceae bacterium zg-893]|nr:4Fe-4S ferredoxin [Eggerthellaceae bacterium zg-893]
MTQIGFYFNQAACIGCRSCQVACCDRNNLAAGETLRTVTSYETGTYPEATIYHFAAACNHCANPACVANCPTGACQKDPDDGTVFRDAEVCIGCGTCATACPYEHPVMLEDLGIIGRCDGCKSFRDNGLNPVCVDACVMRALEFGDIEELRSAHPDAVSDAAVLPDSSETTPSLLLDLSATATDKDFRPFTI